MRRLSELHGQYAVFAGRIARPSSLVRLLSRKSLKNGSIGGINVLDILGNTDLQAINSDGRFISVFLSSFPLKKC